MATTLGAAAEEYAAVRQRVGLIDRSDWGVVEVTGRDRATFLHALLSNDVKSLTPGQGCAAALLDVHGKVQAFMLVWALEDRILVPVPPGLARTVVEALDKYLFSEKAILVDASDETTFVLLAGPGVPDTIERVAGIAVAPPSWSHAAACIADVDARVVRGGGETGETEAWVVCARRHAAKVRETLIEARAQVVGHDAWESLRIEAGTPVFGVDADQSVLLPEVPFLDRVSYTKGCYVGQEVVVRIRDRGHVNRMLAGLVLDEETVPSRGASIVADGSEVGHVTSATWSFGLEQPIALGFVRRQHAVPGTRVDIDLGGKTVAAAVSSLPFKR